MVGSLLSLGINAIASRKIRRRLGSSYEHGGMREDASLLRSISTLGRTETELGWIPLRNRIAQAVFFF